MDINSLLATDHLQFLRPVWLWLLPVIALCAWYSWRARAGTTWSQYIAADKLPFLLTTQPSSRLRFIVWTLATVVGAVALAGPSWQQHPVAALKNRQSMVVLLDLSPSMLAWDVKPDRLTHARLKIIDLLKRRREGETALVVFGGDAFRVSPLTDDPDNIIELIPTLHPSIMPAPGSQTEAAVQLGIDLLRDAGVTQGDLLLVTDGVEPQAIAALQALVDPAIRLSVLAVGSEKGSPVPTRDGSILRSNDGQVITAPVNHQALKKLASLHGGRYAKLTVDDADINWLSAISERPFLAKAFNSAGDSHVDAGWWLVLLLIPVAALAFRRQAICLIVLSLPLWCSSPVYASQWQSWWFNPDQRAAQALADGQTARAAELFESDQWAGFAAMQSGRFAAAAKRLESATDANSHYNRATALALSGQLKQALAALELALLIDPEHQNALFNRNLIRQALTRRREQSKDSAQREKTRSDNQQPDNEASKPQQGSDQGNQVGGTSSTGQSQDQQAIDQASRSAQQAEPARESPTSKQTDQVKPGQPVGQPDITQQVSGIKRKGVLNPYSEQWLRDLPDDPGALMRRKFRYQARIRQQNSTKPAGPSGPPRY